MSNPKAVRRLARVIATTSIIIEAAFANIVVFGRSYGDPTPIQTTPSLSYLRRSAATMFLEEGGGGGRESDDSTNTIMPRQLIDPMSSNLLDEATYNVIIRDKTQNSARHLRGDISNNYDSSRHAMISLAIIFASLIVAVAFTIVVSKLAYLIPCVRQQLNVIAEESSHGRHTRCPNPARVLPLTAEPPTTDVETAEIQDEASPSATDNKGPTCWVCLEHDDEDGGEPLRRDCSCRGEDSGFAHLSCIVEFAECRSKKWHSRHCEDLSEFTKPWDTCINCNQSYQNELALDIADRFVTFAIENNHPNYQQFFLEALALKLRVLVPAPSPTLLTMPRLKVKIIALNLLSLIQKLKAESSTALTMRSRQIEPLAHNHLGVITLAEEMGFGAKAAVTHFQKSLQLSKAIGDAEGVAIADINIACAKSKYEENHKNLDVCLKRTRDLYELRVAKYGEENAVVINDTINLGIALWTVHRVIEAEKVMGRVFVVCERIHGQEHKTTRHAKTWLRRVKERRVWVTSEGERKLYQALRYEMGYDACVIQGPIEELRIAGREKTHIAAIGDIRFAPGTPIVCVGFVHEQTIHLNGKTGCLRSDSCNETDTYKVYFEDDYQLEPCLVERNNLRILFDLNGESQEEE
jgi:hypothetical protein